MIEGAPLSRQGPPRRRDIPSVTDMPLYSIKGSKKRKKKMDYGIRTKNNKTDDKMKGVMNDRTKRDVKKTKKLGDKTMNG